MSATAVLAPGEVLRIFRLGIGASTRDVARVAHIGRARLRAFEAGKHDVLTELVVTYALAHIANHGKPAT